MRRIKGFDEGRMMKLRHQAVTGKIIGSYYDVYNGTGRTYPEYVYERGLMMDLTGQEVKCYLQPEYQVLYKGIVVGKQVLDLFVAEVIGVEIKVATALTRLHKAQGISYLKVVGVEDGLLLNFGSAEPEFERLFFNRKDAAENPVSDILMPAAGEEALWPELTHKIIGGLFEVHTQLGPGFIHRIYANAAYREMQLRGLNVVPRQKYQVYYRGQVIGEVNFNHLLVENKLMVFPVAVQSLNDVSIINLKAWMYRSQVRLGILANFYATKLEFLVLRA
jgi:GxxExxY protein